MRQQTPQRGLSMIGFLFVAVVVVTCVMIGFRVMPAYIEWYSIQKAMKQALDETRDVNVTQDIRNNFQRHADAGYIESISGKDLEITKTKNEVTANASWTRKLPMVANVSLWIDFEATATR